MSKELLLTFPLNAFIKQIFGDEEPRYYVPVEPVIAQVFDYHIKNSGLELTYKIQYTSHAEISRFSVYKEQTLAKPFLWVYRDWYNSDQNYNRLKALSEKERTEDEMLKKNVKIVAKAYREFTDVQDIAVSEAKAYGLLKGNKMKSIQALGVELSKLVTTKEQL